MTKKPNLPETGKNRREVKARHYRTRITETRLAALAILLALLFLQSRWGTGGWQPQTLKWLGYPLLVAGVLGRTWCAAYIGGRKSRIIVDRGPYSATRNPLYVFSFIGLTGIGLSTGMVTAALVSAVLFMLYYRRIVASEEAYLAERQGQAYAEYRARVPRWIPDFSLWREAEEPMGMPRSVYLAARDAAAFLLAPPLFALIGALQDWDVLPVLLRLP